MRARDGGVNREPEEVSVEQYREMLCSSKRRRPRTKAEAMRQGSSSGDPLAERLAWDLRQCGLGPVETGKSFEWQRRNWEYDLWLPEANLIVEVEGGIYRPGGGAHSRPANIMRDIEKYNELVLHGIWLLRVTPTQVKNGQALDLVERFIERS